MLNYPIRINDKLSGVYDAAASGVAAPSKQVRDVFNALSREADVQLEKLKKIKQDDIPKLNALIREKTLPIIGTEIP